MKFSLSDDFFAGKISNAAFAEMLRKQIPMHRFGQQYRVYHRQSRLADGIFWKISRPSQTLTAALFSRLTDPTDCMDLTDDGANPDITVRDARSLSPAPGNMVRHPF